jgi:hypothetical protein
MTLVEVTLAVAILALGLSVLLATAAKCLAVMKLAGLYQQVHWTLGVGDLEHPVWEAEEAEDMEVAPEEYPNGLTYSREVDDDEDEDGLYVVKTRISWEAHEEEAADEVVSYVWHPEDKK